MSPDMQYRVFDVVGKDFVLELCKPRGFAPIDPPAERHGSWEWTLHKRAKDEIDRFVCLAFTTLPQRVPDAAWYEVEVCAGAERNDRYTRKTVSDFRANASQDYRDELRSALKEPLVRAMSVAEALKLIDLTEAYSLPRGRQP
jgi:hypothetical protein